MLPAMRPQSGRHLLHHPSSQGGCSSIAAPRRLWRCTRSAHAATTAGQPHSNMSAEAAPSSCAAALAAGRPGSPSSAAVAARGGAVLALCWLQLSLWETVWQGRLCRLLRLLSLLIGHAVLSCCRHKGCHPTDAKDQWIGHLRQGAGSAPDDCPAAQQCPVAQTAGTTDIAPSRLAVGFAAPQRVHAWLVLVSS